MEEGMQRLEQAMRDHPGDQEARTQYYRQRELLGNQWLAAAETARGAGRMAEAEAGYRRVLKLDPVNPRAANGLAELGAASRQDAMVREAESLLKKGDTAAAEGRLRAVLTENPGHGAAREALGRLNMQEERSRPDASAVKSPFEKPITLEFRDTPLKAAFEVISRTSGLNFVFDKDVRGDSKITLFVRNTSIDEALRLILATNQLERKMLNDNSVLVYPNTAAKNKDYQELVTKTFYLANTDVKQAQALIKTMVKSKDIFVDEKLNMLVVKDTPAAVRLAERLIASLDLAEPEVMLEVEVMEVSRNKLLKLGLQFPDQVGYGRLTPDLTNTTITTTGTGTSTTLGGALAAGNIDLRNRNNLTSYVANPGVLLNLKDLDGDSRLLANPRIRVINHSKAKIHIGDKLPVFTTTSTANVGVSASVSYLDVGLKLEVEPTVHLDEDVAIKVNLEVSSIIKEVPGPSNSLAYQVGNRSAETTLRLRDGETQVLAGLINDEERSAASRLPGLGELPIVGRLFSSSQDSSNKTEIVLLITPRIVRNVLRPAAGAPAVASGTEAAVGAAPLLIRNGALKGVAMGSSGAQAPTPAVRDTVADDESGKVPPALSMAMTTQAQPGQEVAVLFSLPGTNAVGGQVDLALDPAFFETGSLHLDLKPGGDGMLKGEAKVRLLAGTKGTTQVQVTAASALDAQGAPVSFTPPPSQAIVVAP
ncbi:MAG: general secretion pathway protein GspD [Rhodocyclaceae bacterium]|nr:MAG: general secretion pathway protein GspD [Rhodocyclaceae bacterium]